MNSRNIPSFNKNAKPYINMKKPNITEGPWKFSFEQHQIPEAPECAVYHVWEIEQDKDSPLHVAHVNWVEGNDEQSEANAKAISAVPEMIDLLIESFKAIESLPDDALGVKAIPNDRGEPEPQPIKWELLYDIKEVLKKAGVEF